jgi:hypothetical protein
LSGLKSPRTYFLTTYPSPPTIHTVNTVINTTDVVDNVDDDGAGAPEVGEDVDALVLDSSVDVLDSSVGAAVVGTPVGAA